MIVCENKIWSCFGRIILTELQKNCLIDNHYKTVSQKRVLYLQGATAFVHEYKTFINEDDWTCLFPFPLPAIPKKASNDL